MRFRRLDDDDLPMLHRWLNEPGVVRWWEGEDVSWEAVVREYGTSNPDPVEHWIASVANSSGLRRDVGWIQCYAAADEPEESDRWWAFGVDRRAAGIDYLIGDLQDRGRGLGSTMIRAFVVGVVFGRHPEWPQVCASPYVANVASWRALARAGFQLLGDFDTEDGPCRLMMADQRSFALAGQGAD